MIVDAREVRETLVDGIDKLLSYRLMGPSAKQRAVLKAVRQLVESDQSVADKLAPLVGPYGAVGDSPPMSAIDWDDILTKLPALATLLLQIVNLLKQNPTPV